MKKKLRCVLDGEATLVVLRKDKAATGRLSLELGPLVRAASQHIRDYREEFMALRKECAVRNAEGRIVYRKVPTPGGEVEVTDLDPARREEFEQKVKAMLDVEVELPDIKVRIPADFKLSLGEEDRDSPGLTAVAADWGEFLELEPVATEPAKPGRK